MFFRRCFHRWMLTAIVLFLALPVARAADGVGAVAPVRRGVLILAHGGSRQWNRTVKRAVEEAHLDAPTQIAFGMGFHQREARDLQQAVRRLEASGAREIIVVPLLVSSSSEVFRQLEYLLGQRPEPAVTHEPLQPVTAQARISIAPPLDDDPAVAEIVVERARNLSREPQRETLILVAHGPNEEADNARWLACMAKIAQTVQQQTGFRRVETVSLRDDAPESVKAEATAHLRALVEEASRDGEALIVPLLIARGGIEQGIPKRLQGLPYRYSGETLLPDARISRWLKRRVVEKTL